MTSKKNSIDNFNLSNKEDTLNKSATSVYNEKELKYLDKYLPLVHNAFDEDELYEIILDCDFKDKDIERVISEKQRYLRFKGTIYGWNVVDSKKMRPVEANEHLAKENTEEKQKSKKLGKFKKNKNKNSNRKNQDDKTQEQQKQDDWNYDYNINNEESSKNYSDQNKGYQKKNNYKSGKAYYNNYNSYDNYYNYYEEPYYYSSSSYSTDKDNYSYKKNYNDTDSKGYKNYNKGYYNRNHDGYQNYDYNYGYEYYEGDYISNHKTGSSYQYGDYKENNNNRNYVSKYKKKSRPNNNKTTYGTFVEFKEYVPEPNLYLQKLIEENAKQSQEVKSEEHTSFPIKEVVKEPEVLKESPSKQTIERKEIIDAHIIKNQKPVNEHEPQINDQSVVKDTSSPKNNIEEDVEEINVNKTNIENLRSYFERLKQKTIFNENIQANGTLINNSNNAPNNYSSNIYEKFSNFAGMNMPVFNNKPVHQQPNQQEKIEEYEKTVLNEKKESSTISKLLNNLTINNSQILEISSSNTGNKTEVDDGRKISNFSFSFSGSEKHKNKQVESNTNIIMEKDKGINLQNMMPSSSKLPFPGSMGFPTQLDFFNYQNPTNQSRFTAYMSSSEPTQFQTENMPQVDQYGQTTPMYDYSQYPYYQMPLRNFPMQFPGFQNVNYPQYPIDRNTYTHQQGTMNPQDPYAQFAYQMSQHQNMNNYYHGHTFNGNPYLKK